MKTDQPERTPLYITDAKSCARHIAKESLDQIIAGTYNVPTIEEMISVLGNAFLVASGHLLLIAYIRKLYVGVDGK